MKLGKKAKVTNQTIKGFACSCGCGSSGCSVSGCACTEMYSQYANGYTHNLERNEAYYTRREQISTAAVAN